jgi:hypothetical protein
MKLLSLETVEEMKCLATMNKGTAVLAVKDILLEVNELLTDEMAEKNYRYWSSATNLGFACEQTWAWCSVNALIQNATLWVPGEPNSPRTARCGQLALNADLSLVGLDDLSCDTGRYYICEVLKGNKRINAFYNVNLLI